MIRPAPSHDYLEIVEYLQRQRLWRKRLAQWAPLALAFGLIWSVALAWMLR